MQIQTKGQGILKQICQKGNIDEPFSVETDEESYDDEETVETQWVKPSARLYLVDLRILESNMQAAVT